MNLPAIHLLRAAVVLAEVRNYSRAATKLGIHQPTLTKWIHELEQEVGFQLFHRSTQFVEPTEACRLFVEEAKECIFHAERAVHVARVAEQGAQTVLHVGRSQYTDPYLISVLSSVTLPLFPNLEISLASVAADELEAEVTTGKMDVAIAIGRFDNPRITELTLMTLPFYVVLAENHPLAQNFEITMKQLDKTSWALFDRSIQPTLHDAILREATRVNTQPKVVHHFVTAEEAAQALYVAKAEVAFLTRAGAWRVARGGLTMRPLQSPNLAVSSTLIARANDASRIVSEFVRAFRRKLDMAGRKVQLGLPLVEP